MNDIAFRLDVAVDPAGELGVVEARRASDGAPALRVWNVEHAAYVCEHEPTRHEEMHWLENGASAHEPPCAHCAAGPYPRCAPGSERARQLRARLWRTPVSARAVMALLVAAGADGDGDPGKRKQPDEPEPPAPDEPPAQRQRREVERILREPSVLDQPPDILMEILLRLSARDMLAVFDVRPSHEMWQGMRQTMQRLRSAVLAGFMLHTARQGRTGLLRMTRLHGHFWLFAPAALIAACETGRLDAVHFLLDSDRADPDDSGRQRPLLAAVWNGHLDVVTVLLDENRDRRADPKVPQALILKDVYHMAAFRGDFATVAILLDNAVAYASSLESTPTPVPMWRTVQQMAVIAGVQGHVLVTTELAERLFSLSNKADVLIAEVYHRVQNHGGTGRPTMPTFENTSVALEPLIRLSGAPLPQGNFSRWLHSTVEFHAPVNAMLLLESGLADPLWHEGEGHDQRDTPPALYAALRNTHTERRRADALTMLALLLADGRSDQLARDLLKEPPVMFASFNVILSDTTARGMMHEWLQGV